MFKVCLVLLILSLVGCASTPMTSVQKSGASETRVVQRSLSGVEEVNQASTPAPGVPAVTSASTVPMPVPIATQQIVIQPPEITTWKLRAGETIRSVIEEWSRQAGWEVVWQFDQVLTAQAGAEFTGSYTKAIRELMEALPPSTRVQVEIGTNKVILVTKR